MANNNTAWQYTHSLTYTFILKNKNKKHFHNEIAKKKNKKQTKQNENTRNVLRKSSKEILNFNRRV